MEGEGEGEKGGSERAVRKKIGTLPRQHALQSLCGKLRHGDRAGRGSKSQGCDRGLLGCASDNRRYILGLCMSRPQSRGRDCLKDQGRGIPVPVEGLSGGM